MTKDEIMKDNLYCLESLDKMKKKIEDIKNGIIPVPVNGISGMSGGPLCPGCNTWLLKCLKEEKEKYIQLMRECNIKQFEYKEYLKKKYMEENEKSFI